MFCEVVVSYLYSHRLWEILFTYSLTKYMFFCLFIILVGFMVTFYNVFLCFCWVVWCWVSIHILICFVYDLLETARLSCLFIRSVCLLGLFLFSSFIDFYIFQLRFPVGLSMSFDAVNSVWQIHFTVCISKIENS